MTQTFLSADPAAILQEVFGYNAFRGAQAAIIAHMIGGGDALVLMPTGGGKSLCYQIPAIARHRTGRGDRSGRQSADAALLLPSLTGARQSRMP